MTNNIPPKKKISEEDLVGFGEFVEEFDLEVEPKKQNQRKDLVSEISNLIERDTLRLNHLNSFVNKKIPFIEQFDQSEVLVEKIELENAKLEKHLLDRLMQEKSHFLKNMDHLWESFFSQN